jgi:hypothetical protein
MHDNPRADEREQELAQTERQNEEESMRYPEFHDPDGERGRARADDEE